MITLDRRIEEIVNIPSGCIEGIYQYTIRRVISANENETIFVGNYYYNGVDAYVLFDVTDIIANDSFVIKEDAFEGVYSLKNKIANKYELIVTCSSNTIVSSIGWVAKVSSYNNKILGDKSYVFRDPDTYPQSTSILMQGYHDTDTTSVLTPHYPMFADEELQVGNDCPFALSCLVGNSNTGTTINCSFNVDSYTKLVTITPSGNTFTYISNVSNAADYRDIVPLNNGVFNFNVSFTPDRLAIRVIDYMDTYIYVRYTDGDVSGADYPYAFALVRNSYRKDINDSSLDFDDIATYDLVYSPTENLDVEDDVYKPYTASPDTERYEIVELKTVSGKPYGGYTAAIFDVCPKRYYLFWQDRYGSFQCQPFNDYITYSETYNKTEVQDYQNRRRNVNIQIQSDWKLNSGWIDENLYPYYESIYTSQILFLFDSKENKRYTVMVSDNYEEKTYKNQKKLINMQLNLQENKKQSIIY